MRAATEMRRPESDVRVLSYRQNIVRGKTQEPADVGPKRMPNQQPKIATAERHYGSIGALQNRGPNFRQNEVALRQAAPLAHSSCCSAQPPRVTRGISSHRRFRALILAMRFQFNNRRVLAQSAFLKRASGLSEKNT